MTALLLLLGLLSAGAGAYTLFRDPNRSQGSSTPGSSSGSSGGGGSSSGAGSGPSPAPGDRGKLVNVGEPSTPSAPVPSPGKQSSSPSPPSASPPLGQQEWQGPSSEAEKPSLPGLKKSNKLNLPHLTDDIIRNNSRYAHHRRPLLHSEALVDKENFLGALEILKRTNSRIPDQDINRKIGENIQAIEDHLTSPPEEDTYSPDDPNYAGPPIPMGDLVRAIKDISQAMGSSLSQGFATPIQIQAPPGAEPPKLPAELPPGPVSYQIISYAPSSGPIPPPPPGTPSYSQGGIPGPPGPPGGGGGGVPSAPSSGGDYPPSSYEPPQAPERPSAPEHLDPNEMDLPSDTFFTDEWEKFKDLPLVDRRTGEDRRSGGERRGDGGTRKDRRGEDDRRKEDLFQQRDDYLKKKSEEKREERARQEEEEPLPQDWPRPEYPLSDQLPQFAAPILPQIDLVPIRLPEPEDKVLRGEVPESPSPPATAPAPEAGPAQSLAPVELPKIDLPDPVDERRQEESAPDIQPIGPGQAPSSPGAEEAPEIEVLEGGLEPLDEDRPESSGGGDKDDEPKMIHGILELKPPEVDDAPFLTLTYDFGKIPHSFKLSKNYSIMEYSYYKYKPMLIKAQEFARRKMLKNALNYYRVIKSQNIPPELRKMINRNIKDITEFMEKYLMAKG
ncbi:hypothetical protein EHQ27_05600 [Leptospira wolffii]|uniref:hypothetical protein n=1 Tax=Leptospira wolffii TaxID=409998 RepID=UPI0010837632|nr:hypothetical protein [Leptospira wolffii]TGK62737.1 hypothetical protein EHQ32_08000 [Leptospira wolffii]TGK73876.1 hypothetical protein EHQ35_05765 [Leptospira wolffii]TGK75031.1 hypothetical protein EHQ27_05600 [Leptospira wolffii]TGL28738.1 hypothetical protein EHQ57_12290 [Leptospira wolffii]